MAVQIQLRRARRTDFIALMALLTECGLSVPPPDRATLRRFRNIVADLGTDLYMALVDGSLAGCVHVTYARQLARPPRASLDLLLVGPPYRQRGVGKALLALARERAQRRGGEMLVCTLAPDDTTGRRFLEHAGWQRRGDSFVQMLPGDR